MFHKVIVGFDGSEHARDALALGAVLTAGGGELIVCCVPHFKSLSARLDRDVAGSTRLSPAISSAHGS